MNISDILEDGEMCSILQLTRYEQSVDDKGRTVTVASVIETPAVVYPSTPDELQRLPEADYSTMAITIYTKTVLHSSKKGFAPDIVQRHGDNWLVKSVEIWEDYGYCAAIAIRSEVQNA